MAQGLQIFDENGNLQIDVSTQLTKILGEFVIRAKDGDGEKVDERLTIGTPFVCVSSTNAYGNFTTANVEISGTQIKWNWARPDRNGYATDEAKIMYGVF